MEKINTNNNKIYSCHNFDGDVRIVLEPGYTIDGLSSFWDPYSYAELKDIKCPNLRLEFYCKFEELNDVLRKIKASNKETAHGKKNLSI